MRRWLLIALLVVGVAGYFGLGRMLWPPGPPSGARAVTAAIPVAVGAVQRADVPIFLAGLGTVQAFNSVLVKSRVDGQIVKVNFSEGKDVPVGEVLVEIDPAPFAATLAQAQANKLKDQAQLDNARVDLDRFARLAKTGAGTTQQLDNSRLGRAAPRAPPWRDRGLPNNRSRFINRSGTTARHFSPEALGRTGRVASGPQWR